MIKPTAKVLSCKGNPYIMLGANASRMLKDILGIEHIADKSAKARIQTREDGSIIITKGRGKNIYCGRCCVKFNGLFIYRLGYMEGNVLNVAEVSVGGERALAIGRRV